MNHTESHLPEQGPVSEVTTKHRARTSQLSPAQENEVAPSSEVSGTMKVAQRITSPLQEGELSEREMTRYLSEVFGGATSVSIRVKDSARAQLRPLARLPELHRLLLEKHVWGAQIRYSLQDAEWTDTLIVTHSGAQVVRVRH